MVPSDNENINKINMINEINKLILQYRKELTTNVINSNGGFDVKPEITEQDKQTEEKGKELVEASIFTLNFLKYKIEFTHLGGNISGLIDAKGNCIFLGSWTNSFSDNQEANKKKKKKEAEERYPYDDWATRNYFKGKIKDEDIIRRGQSNSLKEYEKSESTKNIKNLSTIYTNLHNLFTKDLSGKQDEDIKNIFHTFLLVCSECAKNSLLHQQLISNLLYHYEAEQYAISKGDKYEEREFSNDFLEAFMTAAQNCGNGAINYINKEGNGTELDKIIDGFQLKNELERVAKDDESFLKKLLDRLMENGDQIQIGKLERNERRYLAKKGIRYENISITTSAKNLRYLFLIKSQYYKDCQTLLDLTGENINNKIDSSFVSRIIKYLDKKDARIANLIKLKRDSLISLILNVNSNLGNDKKAQMIKALINNQIFSDFFQTMKQQWSNCNTQTIRKEMGTISNLLVLATRERDKEDLNNFIKDKVDEMLNFMKTTLQKNEQYDFERKLDWAKQAVGLVNDPEIKGILNNIITIAEDASIQQKPKPN